MVKKTNKSPCILRDGGVKKTFKAKFSTRAREKKIVNCKKKKKLIKIHEKDFLSK